MLINDSVILAKQTKSSSEELFSLFVLNIIISSDNETPNRDSNRSNYSKHETWNPESLKAYKFSLLSMFGNETTSYYNRYIKDNRNTLFMLFMFVNKLNCNNEIAADWFEYFCNEITSNC